MKADPLSSRNDKKMIRFQTNSFEAGGVEMHKWMPLKSK